MIDGSLSSQSTNPLPPTHLLPHTHHIGLNYGQVLYLSSMFYDAQRSGALPPTNRIPWRGDSALTDGADKGLDLSGGWYDAGKTKERRSFPTHLSPPPMLLGNAFTASLHPPTHPLTHWSLLEQTHPPTHPFLQGDHLKFAFTMGFTCTTLAWSLLEFPDAYDSVSERTVMLDTIKWGLDWLLKAHYKPDALVYQVGTKPFLFHPPTHPFT